MLEISKRIQIYWIAHQITSLDNISSYIMRRLQSITITFPFNKIISTFLHFFNWINCSKIVVTYVFSDIQSNVPDRILFKLNIVVLIYIGACRQLLWSSTWCLYVKSITKGCLQKNCFDFWIPFYFQYLLVFAPSELFNVIHDIISFIT